MNGLDNLCLGMCYRDFHNIVARTERCVQRTLLFRPFFFEDKIVRWTGGGGGGYANNFS